MQGAAAPPPAVGQAGVRAQLIEADDADVAWLCGSLLDGTLDEPSLHLAHGACPLSPEGSGDAGLQQRCRDHEHDQGVIHLLEACQDRVEVLAGHREDVESDPCGGEHDEGEGARELAPG